MSKMFDFHMDEVAVQNHSWVKPGPRVTSMSEIESLALSNAVSNGRGGKGVVIVRAAGNDREAGRNANDDAYTADPRVITVAALRGDGVVASYSTPGAPILVSAPGGEQGYRSLFTTDRLGTKGLNFISFTNSDLSDYVFSSLGFTGTSAATPLVSGIAALVLSANPELTYRDAQQILILSATQTFADPDLTTNGAGLVVGHNSGFGLVNAGTAVDLARSWKNRPAMVQVTNTETSEMQIPDGALRVVVTGAAPLPTELNSILALPSLGIHLDSGTRTLPLVDAGDAVSPLQASLTGKAALIRRGGAPFSRKIQNAADAGAEFAIIYNNQDGDRLEVMAETDYVPIPAVFISQESGEALAASAATNALSASVQFAASAYEFKVRDPILCEQVQARVNLEHAQRGDLRVTLVSPSGTRSVLQRLGPLLTPVDEPWTYMTTHNFFESAQGTWRLEFSDEFLSGTGVVHSASLMISGVKIKD
jgi:hypothetical protein